MRQGGYKVPNNLERLRRAVNRLLPEAENLLSDGLEGEPDVTISEVLAGCKQYQKARKIIDAHLTQFSKGDDSGAARVDDNILTLEEHVARVGFELGVAYGLLLNPKTFFTQTSRLP
jgi:hypothetical protein